MYALIVRHPTAPRARFSPEYALPVTPHSKIPHLH